jgi:hypothetical protein
MATKSVLLFGQKIEIPDEDFEDLPKLDLRVNTSGSVDYEMVHVLNQPEPESVNRSSPCDNPPLPDESTSIHFSFKKDRKKPKEKYTKRKELTSKKDQKKSEEKRRDSTCSKKYGKEVRSYNRTPPSKFPLGKRDIFLRETLFEAGPDLDGFIDDEEVEYYEVKNEWEDCLDAEYNRNYAKATCDLAGKFRRKVKK